MNRVADCEVISFCERREQKCPSTFEVEVENDAAVLWHLVGLRVETLTGIWGKDAKSETRTSFSPGHLRIALAQSQWKHDESRWIQALAAIRSSRPGPEWQAPILSSLQQTHSLAIALAGCLFWHALQENTKPHDAGSEIAAALLGWRTWIYLKWRRTAERLLHRNRIVSSGALLRFTPLLNAADDPNPDEQCGYLLSGWPRTPANLAFADGMERVLARIALGSWVGDVLEVQRNLMIAYLRHVG